MTAKEIYEKETGNKQPSNQIAYHEWQIEYTKWLEEKLLTGYVIHRRDVLIEFMKYLYDTVFVHAYFDIDDIDKFLNKTKWQQDDQENRNT